jgi:AcrR family transcriptional regulator
LATDFPKEGEKMKDPNKNTRRRGDTLTESIYDATIELIKKVGYNHLTFQQIAQAAKTSRSVLYRRWKTPLDLIRDIVAYKAIDALDGALIDKIEDTGSLRGDLLQLLTLYQSIYDQCEREIMNAILFEMGQNKEIAAELEINATNKNIEIMRKLLGFAKKRGEKIKEVSDETLTLPFDLIRIENILRKDGINTKRLERLVDEILLPVYLA